MAPVRASLGAQDVELAGAEPALEIGDDEAVVGRLKMPLMPRSRRDKVEQALYASAGGGLLGKQTAGVLTQQGEHRDANQFATEHANVREPGRKTHDLSQHKAAYGGGRAPAVH
ncbi:MAG: hypothetical protein IPK80_04415 [Nannocystis sp.]|nr:hypothetical protein [Nannocystis sp.]